jgi:hypothetical protein
MNTKSLPSSLDEIICEPKNSTGIEQKEEEISRSGIARKNLAKMLEIPTFADFFQSFSISPIQTIA